jgi:hypothetical protein
MPRLAKISVLNFLVFLSFSFSVQAEVTSSFWQTDKSQHFIVNYQYAPAGYISELIGLAEKYYTGIIDELGYRRFDFWSWDKRAKIYLYKQGPDYLKDANRSDWSGASVNVKDRMIKRPNIRLNTLLQERNISKPYSFKAELWT